jgi:hypothetical protein
MEGTEGPKKLKIKLPYDPVIPLLAVCLKGCTLEYNRVICTPTFIVFTIANFGNILHMNGLRKFGIYT